MKKVLLSVAFLAAISAFAHSQSAEKLTEIIATPVATYGQVAYITGVYQGTVQEDASYEAAFETLQKDGIIKSAATPDQKIPLQETAFLCAKATKLKGGLFYSLFHNSRYAYRELKAKKILPPSVDSSMTVSGRDVIAVLNGCVGLTGGNN